MKSCKMDKTNLKKIAYELNIELNGNKKAFVFIICSKYLNFLGISNKDLWLKNFLGFEGEIPKSSSKIIENFRKEDFENPEAIGWLYQYFISGEKSRVFENLKNNVKVEKDDIPYATQLFTPSWIVKFLVQNSLGRFVNFTKYLEYYVPVPNGDIKENKKLEDIKFIDPCCGTGHILIYAFELLYRAYIENGFSKEDAIKNIFTKNLYGIDIDDTVCKIAKIVLILKAGSIYNNIFEEDYINDLNIISIKSSSQKNAKAMKNNEYDKNAKACGNDEYSKNANFFENDEYSKITKVFENADEYGSLIKPPDIIFPQDNSGIVLSQNNSRIVFQQNNKEVRDFIKQYKILSQKYDVVVTNPPYMGKKNINLKLSEFLKREYPKAKSEMYAAFIERGIDFTKENGYLAMITIHSWMFISSFKDLRKRILKSGSLINMLHSGAATFSDLSSFNALATSFVFKKSNLDIETCFIRLSDYYNLQEKIDNFKNQENYYYLKQDRFFEIPNSPFIYWISEKVRNCFKNNKRLSDFYQAKQGLATGNNKEFVKFWYEVPFREIGMNSKSTEEFFKTGKTYSLFNKGGIFRKWYGNFDSVIKFDKENYSKLLNQGNHLPSRKYYFQKGITWSLFGFENFGVRFKDYGYVFDVSGSSMFPEEQDLYYVISYLCSNVAFKFLSCIAPTVNFQVGNVASLPFKIINDKKIRDRIDFLAKENIEICKEEWSFYETSIEFENSPLVMEKFKKENLEKTLDNFENYYNDLRKTLRKNEEELNLIFAKIFDVENEIDCKVNDRDLSLKEFNKQNFLKQFLSYSVGCSLGRFDIRKGPNYSKFKYEVDLDSQYESLQKLLISVFGKEKLEENISFIEKTLKIKSIQKYYNKDFIKDHIKQYQGHPIYFLK